MPSNRCPQGHDNPDGYKYCTVCGAALPSTQNMAQPSETKSPDAGAAEPEERRSGASGSESGATTQGRGPGRRALLFVALAVVLALVGGGVVYALVSSGGSSSSSRGRASAATRATTPGPPSAPAAPWAVDPVPAPPELQNAAALYYELAGPHPRQPTADRTPRCQLMLPTGITQSADLTPTPSTNFGGSSGIPVFTAVWPLAGTPGDSITFSIYPRDSQSVADYFGPGVQRTKYRDGSEQRISPSQTRSSLILVPGQACYYELRSSENVPLVDDRIAFPSLRFIASPPAGTGTAAACTEQAFRQVVDQRRTTDAQLASLGSYTLSGIRCAGGYAMVQFLTPQIQGFGLIFKASDGGWTLVNEDYNSGLCSTDASKYGIPSDTWNAIGGNDIAAC